MEDDLKESELIFSSGELEEPSHRDRDVIIANFYENNNLDVVHLHSYLFVDGLGRIFDLVNEVEHLIEEVKVRTVEADLLVEEKVDELGFIQEENGVELDGVRFTHESIEFSLYSTEDGSIARASSYNVAEGLSGDEFESTVTQKLEEFQAELEVATS